MFIELCKYNFLFQLGYRSFHYWCLTLVVCAELVIYLFFFYLLIRIVNTSWLLTNLHCIYVVVASGYCNLWSVSLIKHWENGSIQGKITGYDSGHIWTDVQCVDICLCLNDPNGVCWNKVFDLITKKCP